MSSNPDCIFCKIIAGSASAVKITETEHALAFMDLFPASEGHALVIPKMHYENVFESTPETLIEVHLLVRPEIKSIKDLEGKKVSFHTKGAGPTVTGPM